MIITHIVLSTLIPILTQAVLEPFIVGGEEAEISAYPHMGLMSGQCGDKDEFICSSSILNQRILLSAAHCFKECSIKPRRGKAPDKAHKIAVFFGNTFLSKMNVVRVVDSTISHEEWDEIQGFNDIGLAIVRRDIPFGENIKRVILTKKFPDISHVSFEAYVAGWGLASHDQNRVSEHLKEVHQQVRPVEYCSKYGRIGAGSFCAGSMTSDENYPYAGDSGGALVTKDRYHQIGIVSFGWVMYPAMNVYSNVSHYYQWISDNAKRMYCSNKAWAEQQDTINNGESTKDEGKGKNNKGEGKRNKGKGKKNKGKSKIRDPYKNLRVNPKITTATHEVKQTMRKAKKI